jgi:hypothetical protein
MMGAQEKVEGEHLSLPGTLNAAILFKYRFQKFGGGTATTGAGVTANTNENDGMWQMGDEASLFFGGRVTETEHFNIGFLMENNLVAGSVIDTSATAPAAAVNMPLLAGLRLPITVDLGAAKAQIVPFTTDGLGVAYGFEMSSGGVMRANRWAENRRATSAIQYNADRGEGGSAAGTAFVLLNDMGFINLTKWSSSFAPGAGGGWVPSTNYGQNYIRVAATPTIGDWAIVTGFGKESGTSYGNLVGGEVSADQTTFDFQGHGAIGDMETGIYAQYANAPACKAGVICVHNDKTLARKAFSLGGEISVIPHALTIGGAIRNADTGRLDTTTGSSYKDNAVTITAVYDLVQNVALHADYSSYSGSEAKRAGKTSEFLGMLEAAW